MPKIGERFVKIKLDQEWTNEKFILRYEPKNKIFEGVIPDKFSMEFEAMNKTQREKFKGFHQRKSRSYDMENIVTGSTEAEVSENMKNVLTEITTKKLIIRKVIIVDFESDKTQYYRGLDRVSLEFKLGFYEEIIGLGEKPIYRSTENKGMSFNPDRSNVIIEDTPDAREFLTDVHARLKNLGERLDSFFKDREKMIDAFSNGLKLIS